MTDVFYRRKTSDARFKATARFTVQLGDGRMIACTRLRSWHEDRSIYVDDDVLARDYEKESKPE